MSERPRTSHVVSTAVFVPTALAYAWMSIGYPRSGLALFLVFMVWSYLVGVFKRVSEWPLISKITLACGPPLIALGGYFGTEKTTYAMMMPGLLYCVLSIAGGLALQKFD